MQKQTKHWARSIEEFIEYFNRKITKEFKKANPALKNSRTIMSNEEMICLYYNDLKFQEHINMQLDKRKDILYDKVSKLGQRAHEIHGTDLLKRSIHSSESQSKSGKKGGAKNVETGWVYKALELGRDAQKRLLESGTPEGEAYRKILSNNGTVQMQKINKMHATCEKCGQTHQIGIIKQYHTLSGYSDMCGKGKKMTQSMIDSHNNKEHNLKRTIAWRENTEERKKEFIEQQDLMFKNVPEVFTRKEFDAIGLSLGIKTNYNYLKNTKYYEKFGFGKYRKVGSSSVFKTDKEKEIDLIYNTIPDNLLFTINEAILLCECLDINHKSIPYAIRSRTQMFEEVTKGTANIASKFKKIQ